MPNSSEIHLTAPTPAFRGTVFVVRKAQKDAEAAAAQMDTAAPDQKKEDQ